MHCNAAAMVLSLVINHRVKFLGESNKFSVLDIQGLKRGKYNTDSKQVQEMGIDTQETKELLTCQMLMKDVKYWHC